MACRYEKWPLDRSYGGNLDLQGSKRPGGTGGTHHNLKIRVGYNPRPQANPMNFFRSFFGGITPL